jgi:hypothetical protein
MGKAQNQTGSQRTERGMQSHLVAAISFSEVTPGLAAR